jgi:NitT/TauT family transport system substrate-binding protein
VTVESVPSGAAVAVNGQPAGRAPVTLAPPTGDKPTISVACPRFPELEPGAATPPPGALKTVKSAYLPITAYLPLYVALERGYFERFGVKVEAKEANSPNDVVTALASGELDFATALAYTILFPAANRFPGAFRLYSSSEETSRQFTSSIISKQGSPLKSYADLRGRRIGVYQGLVQVVFLKAMLHGMGIDPKDVKIVEISPRLQIQGLVAGEYDALSSTEPTVNVARLQGVAQIVAEIPRTRFIMRPFPSTAAAVSTRFEQRDPEAARGVVAALDLAIEFIRREPETAKSYLPKYTPIPAGLQAQVLADLKLFRYNKLGEENRLNVQRFADYLFETRLIDKRIADVNALFGDYEPPERR